MRRLHSLEKSLLLRKTEGKKREIAAKDGIARLYKASNELKYRETVGKSTRQKRTASD